MLSAKARQENRFSVNVDIDGESLPLTFKAFSLKDYARLKRESTGDDGEMAVVDFLSGILVSWELPTSDTDPTPYPTTAEALADLPPDFLMAVMVGIGESRQVGKSRNGN